MYVHNSPDTTQNKHLKLCEINIIAIVLSVLRYTDSD